MGGRINTLPLDIIICADIDYWLSAERTYLEPGEFTKIRIEDLQPPGVKTFPGISISWEATGGQIQGSDEEVTWIAPQNVEGEGTYKITASLEDLGCGKVTKRYKNILLIKCL